MRKVIVALCIICLPKIGFCQVSSATLQAVFLFSSTKYLEWPLDELPNFEILVVGDGEIYRELVKFSKSRKVKNKNIVVNRINSASELTRCHIIVVLSASHTQLEKVVSFTTNTPTLIVTSNEFFFEKGSDLNFIQKGDKLSYQLNKVALQTKGIKVASAFSSMADNLN